MPQCTSCQTEIADERDVVLLKGIRRGAERVMCRQCVENLEEEARRETENPDLPRALMSGLAAAVLACVIWYGLAVWQGAQYGIIAVGVGWLVGMAVMRGAGKKRGRVLQIYSGVLTLFAMVFAEYFILRHLAIGLFAVGDAVASIPLFLPPGEMIGLLSIALKGDSLTPFFWLFAAWVAFDMPAPKVVKRVSG